MTRRHLYAAVSCLLVSLTLTGAALAVLAFAADRPGLAAGLGLMAVGFAMFTALYAAKIRDGREVGQ